MDSPFKFICLLGFSVCQFISVSFFENNVLFQLGMIHTKSILTYKLIFFSYCNERAPNLSCCECGHCAVGEKNYFSLIIFLFVSPFCLFEQRFL
jgi:hypothetical protein